MIPPTKTPIYSRQYAEDVVNSFIMKYSRATISIARIYGVDPKYMKERLVKLFRYRNARWNVVRDMIKAYGRRDIQEDMHGMTTANRRIYLQMLSSQIEDRLIDEKKLNNEVDKQASLFKH